MHELSICTAIAGVAARTAAGRRVERVRVDIGHLRQVVPATLGHSWEMVVFDTPLQGAELEINYVPAVIRCRSCAQQTELDAPVFVCGHCGSYDTEVVAGDELVVTSLDVARG